METRRNITTNTVGFCLLPSELIQYIIVNLVLPDIFLLRSVNKFITSVISDQDFIREYNIRSSSSTWVFIYKKRWHRDAVLHGFTDCSNRWFRILIADVLRSVIPPGEDLYFLTASGNYFLFALNTSQQVMSVNPMTKTVKKIPPSPLGRRGTSSWRRSGIKLLSGPPGSDCFRFLFVELHEDYPTLFVYSSDTNKWQSIKAREIVDVFPGGNVKKESCYIYLSVLNGQSESILIAVGADHCDTPVVVRPRFDRGRIDRFAVGFLSGHTSNRFHVYGDGNMMIVRSDCPNDRRVRMLKGVELWGMSENGREWELISRVPDGLIDDIKKPYGVMMGCVMLKDGTFRAVLMSNFEGVWNIIWLCYDMKKKNWSWVPLPDCKMKNSNMAGITFSSGLTLC